MVFDAKAIRAERIKEDANYELTIHQFSSSSAARNAAIASAPARSLASPREIVMVEHRKPNPDPRGQAGDRGRSPKGRRGP